MVAMPSQAQSRKERKAAEKAAWEARQQFIKDSTEIANKQRLDEMKKAPQEAAEKAAAEEKARREAAAKADAEKRQREAEEKAKQQVSQNAKEQEEVDVEDPCEAWNSSTEDLIRGHGVGVDTDQAGAEMEAHALADRNLEQQLSKIFMNVFRRQYDKANKDGEDGEFASFNRMQDKIKSVVKNQSSTSVICCNKTRKFKNAKGKKLYKCYIVVEISAEKASRAAFELLQQAEKGDGLLKDINYEDFDKDFKEENLNNE